MQANTPISELKTRREKVAAQMSNNSIFIIFSNEILARNPYVEYPFRQDSNFWYLTGLNQDQSIIVLSKIQNEVRELVYTPQNNPETELWLGSNLSIDEVKIISGVQNIKYFENFEAELKEVLKGCEHVYLDFENSYRDIRKVILDTVFDSARRSSNEKLCGILKTSPIMRSLRIIKSDWEVDQMIIASQINIEAHQFAVNNLHAKFVTGTSDYGEKQFEADIYYHYNKHGLTWSYPAIVASGKNGCILHYGKNSDKIDPNKLLLVDAGCEYNYYASDITRCYHPKNHMSDAQKSIYNLVLQANIECIKHIASGHATYLSYHQKSIEILAAGLLELGLLSGTVSEIIENKTYKKYYPHGVGHWLGLDVHDLGEYHDKNGNRNDIKLIPGMAVTVEPGLYFPADDMSIPEHFRGIAVRIEDDIVVVENGVLNLTEGLLK